ncbi:hypothetical protein ES692_13250 [Psychroserpens burtonensis]|uniref:Uncharacterized protein n=1 Tax=Psychroserpens burtonensis TaxID=49278 RepID=A0A5C7B5B5_9FLAO|nr:hypothetical protein [Psychroserpens burtonensis]TXE16286.1 hypothetical protein ES692_13250 [Psychroserpens burtonensis]
MKKLLFISLCFLVFGCEIENISSTAPYMITYAPESILTNTANLSGKVLGEGGSNITEYGIVWSETFPPNINDTKRIEGERIGFFSTNYTDFNANTTYYCASYGINEIGVAYGQIFEFTTTSEPACEPTIDNYIDLGQSNIIIDTVDYENPSGFNDGNVQFETNTWTSALRMKLRFNEIDGNFPLTGEYTTVFEYDNQSTKSNGEIVVSITDFGSGSLGGGYAQAEQKVYVENDGSDNITFIFCGVTVSDDYELTGKFTYNP